MLLVCAIDATGDVAACDDEHSSTYTLPHASTRIWVWKYVRRRLFKGAAALGLHSSCMWHSCSPHRYSNALRGPEPFKPSMSFFSPSGLSSILFVQGVQSPSSNFSCSVLEQSDPSFLLSQAWYLSTPSEPVANGFYLPLSTVKGTRPCFFLKSYLIRSQDVQRCQCNFSMCAETYRPNKQSRWSYLQTYFEMPASYKCLYHMLSSPASGCACVAGGWTK